jgi:hypothetical protein
VVEPVATGRRGVAVGLDYPGPQAGNRLSRLTRVFPHLVPTKPLPF